MSEPVNLVFFLTAAHTKHGFDLNIIIHAIDIGVRMMDDIVLVSPHDHAGP